MNSPSSAIAVKTPGFWIAIALAFLLVVAALWAHGGVFQLGREASVVLLAGGAFGIILQRTRFCFFCILRDAVEGRDARPIMGSWAALAVGTLGSAVIFDAWLPDARAGHLPPVGNIGVVGWPLLPAGFAFGLGMAFSGSCISAHLYRLAEGSVLSVTALFGAALGFVLGYLIWNPTYLAGYSGWSTIWLPAKLGFSGALLVQLSVLALLAWASWRFLHRVTHESCNPVAEPLSLDATSPSTPTIFEILWRRRWHPILGGALVGALSTLFLFRAEPLGVTSAIARGMRRLADHGGWLPVRLEGLDILRGCAAGVSKEWVSLNLLLVIALVVGAGIASAAGGHFAIKAEPLRRHASAFFGGVLLGAGSLLALGCTIGRLFSGITALSICGWVFGLSLVFGVVAGLRVRRLWW